MTAYNDIECANLREKFNTIWKRVEPYIIRRKLTKDKVKLKQYRRDIVHTYNEYVGYIADAYSFVTNDKQSEFYQNVNPIRSKLITAFNILRLEYTVFLIKLTLI